MLRRAGKVPDSARQEAAAALDAAAGVLADAAGAVESVFGSDLGASFEPSVLDSAAPPVAGSEEGAVLAAEEVERLSVL